MSIWNKIKSVFGFGKTEVPFSNTVTVTTTVSEPTPVAETPVVAEPTPVVETTPVPTPVKKPRKAKAKKVIEVEESFDAVMEKFKTGLDKNRKSYFSKMVKEYNAATDEGKATIKSKIEKYMTKNQ